VPAGSPYSGKAQALLDLLQRKKITVLVTAAFLPVPTISKSSVDARKPIQRYGRFQVLYVGTQLPKNAYDYELDQPFDELVARLPADRRPDFIFAMTPQWLPPKHFEKVATPKVIWCHDGDMFLYRAREVFSLYDVRICLTTQEQFEMRQVVGDFSISNLMSDPLNTEFPQTQFNKEKEFDVIFTGSVFDSYHAEKSRYIYNLLDLTDKYKVAVVNGYLPQRDYYDLLSRGKFLPIVSRIAGNPTPRWRDALANSAYVLYPRGTAFAKAFPGCFAIDAGTIAEDVRRHLERYDSCDPAYDLSKIAAAVETEMAIYREGRSTLVERQLKLAAFAVLVLAPCRARKATSERRQVWLTPGIDPSIYGRETVQAKIARVADATSPRELADEKDVNNLAHVYGALALIFPEAPEAEKWRSRANHLFAEGCADYPASLLLHFNYAHWLVFGDNRKSEATRIFHDLLDRWEELEFDPVDADFGFPYTLPGVDWVFPYYEYAQHAVSLLARRGKEGSQSISAPLRSILEAAVYGYLGLEAFERKSFVEGLGCLKRSLQIYPDNLSLLRYLLDARLLYSQSQDTPAAYEASEICDTFLACANQYPAILLSHTHRVCVQFTLAGRIEELCHVLESWYRLSNVCHSVDARGRFEREINDIVEICGFADYIPRRLIDRLKAHREAAAGAVKLSQFENLVLAGLTIREALIYEPMEQALRYRIVPRDILIDGERLLSQEVLKYEIRLRSLNSSSSMRMTAPLRRAGNRVRRLIGRLSR